MFINQLNLNHVRIFECVYRTRSMTAASRELHLTQSGVSQHINSFEEVLGLKLFDRINQRIVPTSNATILYDKCRANLIGLEEAFEELQAEKNQLAGRVRIGVPTEFGNNVIIPLVSKFCQKHPLVKAHFKVGYAQEMNNLLVTGEVDFAFIDEFTLDKRIVAKSVYDETLELCSLVMKDLPSRLNVDFFETLDYVDYHRDESILRRWFKHHYDEDHMRLKVRATIEDAQGIARLVTAGVGVGILPGHLLAKLQKDGLKLQSFKGKSASLKNAISIAYLRDRTQTRTGQSMLDFLVSSI